MSRSFAASAARERTPEKGSPFYRPLTLGKSGGEKSKRVGRWVGPPTRAAYGNPHRSPVRGGEPLLRRKKAPLKSMGGWWGLGR